MKLVGAFFRFAGRVLEAAKKGGLSALDLRKLDNLLTRTGKRNIILAKGILSALSAGGASEKDVSHFGSMLHKAEKRIEEGKEPFTPSDKKELSNIFQRAYVSAKVARWFSTQVDELLAEEINEFITGARRVDLGVPKKKTVRMRKKTEKRKKVRA